MNPRIQVEHTVTEQITGIDLVRAQILIAQGAACTAGELALPAQKDIPRMGFAVQCRVTTEDPENKFTPNYGKILTFRAAEGFGIRLDAGMGDSGAVITPFYDSLLVKITASGADLRYRASAHGSRSAGVPHPRREDEYSVPRKRHPFPGISRRP